MAVTFNQQEAEDFAALMGEVNRIAGEIVRSDTFAGTLRPEGVSMGSTYESLGIQLVAMYRQGVSPAAAINLIALIAENPNDIETAVLLSMIQQKAGHQGPVHFMAPADDDSDG